VHHADVGDLLAVFLLAGDYRAVGAHLGVLPLERGRRRLAARARRLEAREKAGLRYWRTEEFVEEYLKRGLASMSRQEGARSLGMKPDAYGRAVTRARQAGLIQ